jgi:hypothetical protein
VPRQLIIYVPCVLLRCGGGGGDADAVVAVKTVRKDFLFTKEEMNAVVREFEIHSSLHHPNIVRAWFAVETKVHAAARALLPPPPIMAGRAHVL